MSWYRKSFGQDYLRIYSHRDEQEAVRQCNFAVAALGLGPGDRVLDLGCGYGRHALLLAKSGLQVTGLDLSEQLLSIARENSAKLGLNINYILGDMRNIPYQDHFDAVLSFFTSFGYFDDEEENGQVIKSASTALKQSGNLFLDYLNIHHVLENMVAADKVEKDGYTLEQQRNFDPESFRINKKILISAPDGTREYIESVRAYGLAEIGSFFADAGLICTAVFGDYDGSAYRRSSKRLIVIGQNEA
jgi:SAM-dependent methyltransferase